MSAAASVGSAIADLRHAVRSLRRAPAFTVAAVLTMALGVGVNSVIFSAVNGVLLRPLAYPHPDKLVDLWESEGRDTERSVTRGGNTVSAANLMDYRRENTVFSAMAAYALAPANLTGAAAPRRVWTERVTADFFDVLGAPPALGRTMRAGEDLFGAPRVTVLSHELWRELGGDTAVIGRSIRLDDQPYEVIGVLHPGFQAPNRDALGEVIAAYLPAAYPPALLSGEGHGDHELSVVARLKPGVSPELAQADLTRISSALSTAYPGTNRGVSAIIRPLRDAMVGQVRTPLLVLLGAVAFVGLIMCANLANLLLMRAVGRRREVSVRVALGASRSRIARSIVAQSVVVAAAGWVAGIVLGLVLQAALLRMAPPGLPRLDAITFDLRVFLVTAGLALAAGVAFGALPAWQASGAQPAQSLRDGERQVSGASVLRWQRGLVIAEVALSFVLLVGGGLLLRSFASVMGVTLGFRTDRVLAVGVTLPGTRYPDADARLRFFESLEQRLQGTPGIGAVAFANRLPMRGGWRSGLYTDGSTRDSTGPSRDTDIQAVSPEFFATFGIALLRGRGFTPADRKGGLPVGIVNQAFARTFFPNADPIGHRFRRGSPAPWITIVGVVADLRRGGKTAPLAPEAYLPAAQTDLYPVALGDLAVRTERDPYALLPIIREAVLAIDPEQPVANVRTMDEIVSRSLAMRRFETLLLVLFAATALGLATVGVFGVVSYAATQRTREFGIRVALGARSAQVLTQVLGQAGVLVGAGLGIGAVVALWLTRFLENLLFDVTPTDPATFGAVALVLGGVAVAACAIPARRAAGVDPVVALRHE